VLNVHNSPVKEHRACETHVVQLVDDLFVERLPTKDRVEPEVKLHDHVEEVLVEVVADHERDSSISLSTVEEQKWLKKLEFANCVVA